MSCQSDHPWEPPGPGAAEAASGPPPQPEPVSLGRGLVVGVQTAMVGGTAVGLVESQLFLLRVSGKFTADAELPGFLVLGAVGRYVLTHFLFWSILGLFYSLPLAAWLSRHSRPREAIAPECFHLLVFVVLAAAVLIPADLYLAGLLSTTVVVAAVLGSLTFAAVVFLAAWWASQHGWLGAYRSALRRLSVACTVLVVASAAAVYRSPFHGADRYVTSGAEVREAPGRPDGPPNFLWIILDTVRADHMSCYGYEKPTTPFLDRLAAESAVYTRAIANANWTVPSHASMFTGLAGRQHGATRKHAWLDDEHLTIAELLAEHGYFTASFSNNPHISVGRNFAQGFEAYPQLHLLSWLDKMSLSLWCEWLGLGPPLPWLENDLGGRYATAYISWWLDRLAADPQRAARPWLIFVNFMETHMPYPAPRSYRELFMEPAQVRRSYALRRRVYGDLLAAIHYRFNLEKRNSIAPGDLEILARQYDASIRYLDRRVEELFGVFDRRGLLENTIVIVTSDHGESLGEHEWWEHAYGVYNTVAHVPLIIHYPRGEPAGRLDYPVQPSDLFATLAAWAGIEPPEVPGSQAQDLSMMNPASAGERMVVAEYLAPWLLPVLWAEANVPGFQKGSVVRQLRGAVWGRHKYIWSSDGRHELYDLAADPGETRNLVGSEPGVAGRFAARLRGWVESVPDYVPTGKFIPDLPAEVAQQLKALGYFQ